MKKILFVSALMISAMVMAQQPQFECKGNSAGKGHCRPCKMASPESRAVHKAVKYRDALRLDEKQFNKMYKVYLAEFKSRQGDTTFSRKNFANLTEEQKAAKKAEFKKIIDNRQKQMQKFLDDAQFALWVEMDKPHFRHPVTQGQKWHQFHKEFQPQKGPKDPGAFRKFCPMPQNVIK